MIGLPDRHHNHYSRNLRPAIPSDLDPNTHFVGVRLISTGGKPLCQTRFSLSCAISMHGLFLLCFLLHQLRCPDFSHIFHINTQSLGGAAGSRFYQSLVAGFIARTFSAQIDCRALSIYLLQEATSSNTYSAAQRAYQLDYVMSSR